MASPKPPSGAPDPHPRAKKASGAHSQAATPVDGTTLPGQWKKIIAAAVQVIAALFALFGDFLIPFAPPLPKAERLVVPLTKLLATILLLLIYAEAARREADTEDAHSRAQRRVRRGAW